MRRRHLPYIAVLLAAGIIAGCAGDEAEIDAEPSADVEPAPPSPAPPVDVAPASGGATLTVAESPEHGSYVADGDGRALYLLEDGGDCYDACAATWPPLLASDGGATAGAGLQADMLGTAQRTDGTTQVTYGGHALYRYAADTAPGQTNGQDVTDEWGEWYLVGPSGDKVEDHGGGDDDGGGES